MHTVIALAAARGEDPGELAARIEENATAALGLPGIILWGATAEEIWRPPSEHMLVLRHPAGLEQLAVSAVIENLDRLVPQRASRSVMK